MGLPGGDLRYETSRACPRWPRPHGRLLSATSVPSLPRLGCDPRTRGRDGRGSADPEPRERRGKRSSPSLEEKEEKGEAPLPK